MDDLTLSHPGEEPDLLRKRFAEDGYLLVRGLLPKRFIEGVSDDIVSQFQTGGWLDGAVAMPPATVRDQESDATYRAVARGSSFHSVPYEPELQGFVAMILQERVFPYPSKVLRATPPAEYTTEAGRFAHQDYAYWGVADMATTWIPLVAIPRELGGLAIRKGSHLEGPVELVALNGDEAGWATTNYELGDVLIFHCLTAHAALPNRTKSLRVSGDYRWQPVSSPVKKEFIFGAKGRDSEMFSRSFQEAPWWKPVPSDVVLRTNEWDVHVPPPASRFFEVSPAWSNWSGPA